jgi:murein DD-endopeptidase MepM/ murein hydrolase activator NlpD
MRRPGTITMEDVAIPGATRETPFQETTSGFNVPASQGAFGLAEFMASIRRLESGSYEGDYGAIGRRVKGDNARGAYQIMSKNWSSWSAAAGIPGADWRNRSAQDKVAAHMMGQLYEQFRDWDLVAVAWYAGGSNARTLQRRGWTGSSSSIRNKHIRGYVNKIRGFYPEARQYASGQVGGSPQTFYATSGQRGQAGFLFPLPGSESRWSDTYGADRAGGRRKHKGADIGGKKGAPLVAVVNGTAYSGYNSTAGNYVYVTDEGNNFRYFYAHLDKQYVPRGSGNGVRVGAGQQIGTVGATGNAGGPHLHFGVYDLKRGYINPTSWLQAARSGGSAFAPPPSGNMGADSRPPGAYDDPNAVPGQSGGISYEGMMRNFFEQYGNSIAGGKRVDPRTIGIQEEEGRGVAETLIGQDRESAATAAAGALEVAPVSRETDLLSSADDKGVTV